MAKFFKNRIRIVAVVLSAALAVILFASIDPFTSLISELFYAGSRPPLIVGGLYLFSLTAGAMLWVASTASKNRPTLDQDYAPISPEVDAPSAYVQVANNLNIRITILEARSLLIYWTMICVIVSGVMLILFSGYLSSFDSYATNLWNMVEQGDPVSTTRFSLDGQTKQELSAADTIRLQAYLAAKADLINVMTDMLRTRTDDGKTFNVGSTVLRVSILGMLVFLVQILMQLYRYNSRLITFYSSRRDAIMLSAGEQKGMREFSEMLLPTNLDFGKELHHPFAEAAQALREGTINFKTSVARVPRKSKPKVGDADAGGS